jgi:hypothetical protein
MLGIFYHGGIKKVMIWIRICNGRVFVILANGRRSVAWWSLWTSPKTLAISMSRSYGFFFVDIEKEGQ